MSTGPPTKSPHQNGQPTLSGGSPSSSHDEGITPKFDLPPSVKVMTPSLSEETATVTDYFARDPNGSETQSQFAASSPSTAKASPPRRRQSNALSSTNDGSVSSAYERPLPQREISTMTDKSMESTESAATVTPATAALNASQPGPTLHARPAYPNQSFAVLQNFQYPIRGPSPMLRQRSSHPSQILTFSSAIASHHQSGTRTAGNSPAVTPGHGLFMPAAPSPPHEEWDSPETPGTYASPFLHFTHRQAPKETHVADVDVDPISGRKLINHYEIIDELGRGTHGKVKLGKDLQTQDNHVAIKIVERYSKRRRLGRLGNAEDKVKKEVAILKKARHPNIVALLEVIDDPSRKKVYIVLEWVERGEIQWRSRAPKEVAIVEARRYEREKRELRDPRRDAEDEAVVAEAQRRLRKSKRLQLRAFRKMREKASANPQVWSHEFHGPDDSDDSDDDRMSRISTATADSVPADGAVSRLVAMAAGARRGSRPASPLPTIPQESENGIFEPLTEEDHVDEPQTMTPSTPTVERPHFIPTGLEGTMYGAYDPSSGENSRVNSLANSVSSMPDRHHPIRQTSEDLLQIANEVLDSDLNPELEYVPCMPLQAVRVAFRDTLLGLQYLHYQGIIHRDIKPPNLLQTIEHRVKISDFGVSYLGRPLHEEELGEEVSENEARDLDDEAKELAKTVGTPAFFAPELCITEPTDDPPPITKAIDVWALGITLFCMLYARTPYVDNEFVVMRLIADEEIYIPRRRLQPVNHKSQSRPSSHGRAFPPLSTGRRHESDLVYEEIDDDLHDLLKRLLTKDPRKRVTLEEIRHHPWTVADLPDKLKWLDETDPNRQSQGKKIEVSKEDMNSAVVPLQWVERVRSGIKRVGERLGFGTRGRSGSNAGVSGQQSPPASANSSSSTLNQDARRPSLRGDESIFTALKASREGEHPLSKSVSVTPDDKQAGTGGFFDQSFPRPESAAPALDAKHNAHYRPAAPERSKTINSASGSMRTVKQSDFRKSLAQESPPPSPGLPGTPMALESPGGSGLGGLLGGAGRHLLKTVRERSSGRSMGSDARGRSTDRPPNVSNVAHSGDPHGGPSVAVSQTLAAGSVNPPEALRDATPTSSARNSPASSRHGSVVSSPNRLRPGRGGMLSRNTSTSSIASLARISTAHSRTDPEPRKIVLEESTSEDLHRAESERIRKLIREGDEAAESSTSRPISAFDDRTCPPSPDDQTRRHAAFPRVNSQPGSSLETSPTGHSHHVPGQLPPSLVSSSSDFGSAVSMSISNPSIPSVISEASSVDPAEGAPLEEASDKLLAGQESSDDTLELRPSVSRRTNGSSMPTESEEEEGYSPDREQSALDSSDEAYESSSSDSDGGLVMTRRRSAGKAPGSVTTNGSVSGTPSKSGLAAALEAVKKDNKVGKRGAGISGRGSRKSSRSGSNNTMKKVRTRESDEGKEEGRIAEE